MRDFHQQAQDAYQGAILLHNQGRIGEAQHLYRACLCSEPADFDALHLQGVAAYQEGRARLAEVLIGRAVAGNPAFAPYRSNLSLALLDLGRNTAALRASGIALVLAPGEADAVVNHASTLRECRNLTAAERWAARGIYLRPASYAAHTGLGHTLLLLGRHDQALCTLKASLALSPGNPRALYLCGLTLGAFGRKSAESLLASALRLAPRQPNFLVGFGGLHRFRRDEDWFDILFAAEEDARDLDPRSRASLMFTFAKAWADVGDKQKSFDYVLEANQVLRRSIPYDEAKTLGRIAAAAEFHSRALLDRFKGSGFASDLPVFIVGLPRSGTSLVEQILATHADVFGAGELHDFTGLVAEQESARQVYFPEIASALGEEGLYRLGRDYVERLRLLDSKARHITDKMPANLIYLGLIHLALPDARIILVRRDPVDLCLSNFSIMFVEELNHTYDLGELGRYTRASLRLMDYWEEVIPKDRLMSLRYEDLVADQEGQTRRMLDFLGLPWDPACLSFHKTERVVRTASDQQVRQPLYKSSVGRWRPDPGQLAPLLDALAGRD